MKHKTLLILLLSSVFALGESNGSGQCNGTYLTGNVYCYQMPTSDGNLLSFQIDLAVGSNGYVEEKTTSGVTLWRYLDLQAAVVDSRIVGSFAGGQGTLDENMSTQYLVPVYFLFVAVCGTAVWVKGWFLIRFQGRWSVGLMLLAIGATVGVYGVIGLCTF